ncbi:transglutaminaseTgpA domain-containing protein [Niallia sp. 01092]|uniref:transglutaminaseTgpA domain-containing protein n=1 Tax=unclassified Niallia TaxID=2837522 RepID=UPI003FD38904
MSKQLEQTRTLSNFILYVLGLFLILEWLRPIEELTNTGNVFVFILFLAVSFLLAFFRAPAVFSGLIKVIYMVYILQYLYDETPFFAFSWVGTFVSEILQNMAIMFDTNWPEMTDMFKSLLFFILLWLMAYLIDYWLIKKRKIFTFFLLTMIYITVLDTFTPYNAEYAIVRTVIIGFTVMGMLTYFRLRDKEGLEKDNRFLLKWMAPLLLFVAISAAIGYVSPKAEPIWPDPVPFIQSMSNKSGNDGTGGVKRVGYSVDDSNLGGPFQGDDTVVFQAEVQSPHYWKVETKDTYTGKGWVQSEQSLELNRDSSVIDEGDPIPFYSFEEGDNVKFTKYRSKVEFVQPFSYLLYPLGIRDILSNSNFTIERGNERIVSQGTMDSYIVRYNKPEYSLTALTTADLEKFVRENEDMVKRHLQLPDTLPQRVSELAEEITKNEDNAFSKARAIEKYFSQNGFAYSKSDVAVPGENDDYVDQFLFETKLGYCDNYSTSMVTLLRSIGIPARWVKGFTEGEVIKSSASGSIYEVTNDNAHSWVEAYFPEVGWVTFEPTQGFSNENSYLNDVKNEANNKEEKKEQQKKEVETETKPKPLPEEQNPASQKQAWSFTEWWNKVKLFSINNWEWIAGGLLSAAIFSWLVITYRYKWLPYYFIWRFRNKNKEEDFPEAYLILLRLLKIAGMRKKEELTLREYAKQIDHLYESNEMVRLTAKYEEYLYKGHVNMSGWDELKELWENLIKRTTA